MSNGRFLAALTSWPVWGCRGTRHRSNPPVASEQGTGAKAGGGASGTTGGREGERRSDERVERGTPEVGGPTGEHRGSSDGSETSDDDWDEDTTIIESQQRVARQKIVSRRHELRAVMDRHLNGKKK